MRRPVIQILLPARLKALFMCVWALFLIFTLPIVLPQAEAKQQLRYHVGKHIHIDVDMTNQLEGKVETLNKATQQGASQRQLMEIHSNITNEVYKGSVNANISPHGFNFGVRQGQVQVLHDGKSFKKSNPLPGLLTPTLTGPGLTVQGDILTGGIAAGELQMLEVEDPEIGNTVGSVSLDNGELDSMDSMLLLGTIGTPKRGIVITSPQPLQEGSHVQLISDFLQQKDDQVLDSPDSSSRRKIIPTVLHPSP